MDTAAICFMAHAPSFRFPAESPFWLYSLVASFHLCFYFSFRIFVIVWIQGKESMAGMLIYTCWGSGLEAVGIDTSCRFSHQQSVPAFIAAHENVHTPCMPTRSTD